MSDMSMRLTLQDDASSKLTQVANSARTTATQVQQMGKDLDNAFKTNSISQFSSSLGNAFTSAEKDASSLGDTIDSAMESLQQGASVDFDLGLDDAASEADDFAEAAQDAGESVDDMANSAGDAGESVDELADTANEAGSSMDDLGDSASSAGDAVNSIDGSGSGLDTLASEADQAGSEMEEAEGKANSLASALQTLMAAVSVAAIASAVGDFTSAVIDVGEEYTATISEVAAISGADAAGMEQLESAAREYGATTVYSASEAASALKYMSLAGWDATQSTEALGGVLNLAASAGMDLGEASDIVTDYLTAFGMEASQATELSDAMAYAQSNSNTSVSQLSQAYRNSAATMHAAGQDVYTTTALLESMANQGYKGATAGTALAAVMRDITSSMEDGAIQIGDTAVAVADSEGNFRNLTDILYDVESAVDGMGSAERSTALSDTFTSRSLRAVNMILEEGVDQIYEYEDALENAGGTAGNMASIMTDNLSGDKKMLKSAWQELQLEAFDAIEDPLRNATQYITNSVIPALTEWVPDAFESIANGASSIGKALEPLISGVLQDPSGLVTGLEALAGAFVAMKGVNFASSIGSNLSKWASNLTLGNELAIAAAGIAAGVALIKAAVDEYNAIQIQDNLEAHFGEIELDTSEIEALAGAIIPVDITVQLQLANTYFDEADELISQAEDLLEQNERIEWKARVGITLTEEDNETLISNTQEFVSSVTGALEDEEYAAELTVKALLGDVESEDIISQMQGWFEEDYATVSSLGEAVTDLLQKSIDEGVSNVETSTAIAIMQEKMMELVNGAQRAELQGKLDYLSMTTTGAALTAESWAAVVETVGEYQQELIDADQSAYTSMFAYLNQLEYNDSSRADEIQSIREAISTAYSQTNNMALDSGWQWMYESMNEAYGAELSSARENLDRTAEDWLYNGAPMQNISAGLDKATTGALLDRYETMLPTVQELQSVIDNAYGENGEQLYEIPQAIMDDYNQAMEIGAAAGDSEALMGYMAEYVANSFGSKDEFMSYLDSQGIDFENYTEDVQQAFNRAFTETSDELDFSGFIEGLQESLSGEDIDWSAVEDLLAQYGLTFDESLSEIAENVEGKTEEIAQAMQIEGLTATGETKTIDGGEVAFEYEVNQGDTLSHIAEEAGIALDELLAANPDIVNPDYIETGQLIWVPNVEVEVEGAEVEGAEELGEEAQEAVDDATSDTIEAEQEADITVTGEYDTSGLDDGSYEGNYTVTMTGSDNADAVYSQVEESLTAVFGSPFDIDGDVEITLSGTDDADSVWDTTNENLTSVFGTAFETPGNTNVTISQTNNASQVYSEVASALRSAFATTISVSANASITVNYSLANPSATIDFGGGGTGSATVTASVHAAGGIFDEPHLGWVAEAGPEAIIPLDGSDNALSLWEEAGRQLGFEYIDAAGSSGGARDQATGESASGGSSERVIDIRINGEGAIRVSGNGVSKDEIVDIMVDNLRDVFEQIVEEEVLEEGDGTYEW